MMRRLKICAPKAGDRASARRENNATTWLRVVAGRNGDVLIRDNFNGRTPAWNCGGVRRDDDNFRVPARKGAVIKATLPKPERAPDAPANAAQPLAKRSP